MNLKYMKVSLFEITYKKKWIFHDILIYWDAPALLQHHCHDQSDGAHAYNSSLVE